MSIERRSITLLPQLRSVGDKPPMIAGHVALFNAWSPTYFGLREQVSPDFFDDVTGRNADVPSLFNHDPNHVLGRTTAAPPTLRLQVDKNGVQTGRAGLYTETDLNPESVSVRDLVIAPMQRGEITGASFAFATVDGAKGCTWKEEEDGTISRTLLKAATLYDVSPAVTSPYYPQTDMALRARRDLAAATAALEALGAESGDVRVLADAMLANIIADPQARALSPKEAMLVAAAIGLLSELLPDEDEDEEPATASTSSSGTVFSLFKRARKVYRAITWTNLAYHKSPISDSDSWDAGEEVKKAEVVDLRQMCLGYRGDGTVKGDFVGPHHECDKDKGYPVNKRALIAARGRLGQMKGADQEAGEAHLKGHYKDAGMEWDENAAPTPATAAQPAAEALMLTLERRLRMAEAA
jgi:HK97 family phage prohead protease